MHFCDNMIEDLRNGNGIRAWKDRKGMNRRKKKERVAPMKRKQNVIRIEDRVRGHALVRPAAIFGIFGVLCILYCLSIRLFMGYGSNFYLIWGALGVGFGIISLFCAKPALRNKLPKWMLKAFWICFGIGLAIFVIVEGLVLSRCNATAKDGADVLIVLGAQWKPEGPSVVLRYRLDKAVHYLKVNRDTKVIVTGGQGANEPIAEADGMYDYLVEHGIDGSRILKENRSVNTYENLRFSSELCDVQKDDVVIVTNDFHVFRAEKLARGQGYQHVQGLAADSYLPMQAHNLFREFFGVIKDFLMGNLVYWEHD